jgi:hypothetical protein
MIGESFWFLLPKKIAVHGTSEVCWNLKNVGE